MSISLIGAKLRGKLEFYVCTQPVIKFSNDFYEKNKEKQSILRQRQILSMREIVFSLSQGPKCFENKIVFINKLRPKVTIKNTKTTPGEHPTLYSNFYSVFRSLSFFAFLYNFWFICIHITTQQ